MKRLNACVLLIIVVAMLASVLAGCGKSAEKSVIGTYEGQYTKFVGDPDEAKVTDEEFSLELKSGGVGIHHRDGMDFNLTWNLEGENFTMKETFLGISIDYTGTLKDGRLDIFNNDPEDDFTCEYVYVKK